MITSIITVKKGEEQSHTGWFEEMDTSVQKRPPCPAFALLSGSQSRNIANAAQMRCFSPHHLPTCFLDKRLEKDEIGSFQDRSKRQWVLYWQRSWIHWIVLKLDETHRFDNKPGARPLCRTIFCCCPWNAPVNGIGFPSRAPPESLEAGLESANAVEVQKTRTSLLFPWSSWKRERNILAKRL